LKERFQASDAACRLRFHTQTGGATLTAQQPLNNIVRVALQALAAVVGGTQSLHTNAYDEAIALPTEQSALLALRTQQVLALETGIPDVVDPFAGSWHVEQLTDRMERDARALIAEVDARGGSVKAIEAGYFQDAIARSAYEYQRRTEAGDNVVVGVNRYVTDEPIPVIPAPDYATLAAGQRQRLAGAKARRNGAAAGRALDAVGAAAKQAESPLMPAILEAVRARATVGEISDRLRDEWGVYRPVT
jgi:methylmalonyl-CoA mutase N-terminal domain/subunit